MDQLTATRSELLARRTRLDLARRGRDLLEQKRDQLLDEYRQAASRALTGEDELERVAASARQQLARAEAIDGPEAVRSAAILAGTGVELHTRVATVMGVRIATLERPSTGTGIREGGVSPAGSSIHVDRAAEAFEIQLEMLVDHANRELLLRRLADEIATTTRRVNALEFVVVPQLQEEATRIGQVLDERERQDRFRLKRIKNRRRHTR